MISAENVHSSSSPNLFYFAEPVHASKKNGTGPIQEQTAQYDIHSSTIASSYLTIFPVFLRSPVPSSSRHTCSSTAACSSEAAGSQNVKIEVLISDRLTNRRIAVNETTNRTCYL